MSALDPLKTAEHYGRDYATQIASDPINHQKGPGEMGPNDDLPDGDYVELKRLFGRVTPEMERAYKEGYNSI